MTGTSTQEHTPAPAPRAVSRPSRDSRPLRALRHAVRRDGHLWPLLTFVVVTLGVWARPVLRDPAHLRLSNPGDSESFAYYLSWNVHALTHGLDPFFTPHLYSPDGLDLGNAISIPSVSLLVSPVTAAFGGTAGYNTAFLLSIVLGALAVYLLARELTGSVVGATIAGTLMVVSPYVTGHALSHLNLMWTFGLPLLAYLLVRAVKGTLGRVWLVVWTALVVGFTVGASTELLVTQVLFAVLALVVGLVVTRSEQRRALLRTVPWLALGGVAGLLLGAPAIVAGLRSGIPDVVANDPTLYSTDLTNLVAPTQLILVGDSWFQSLRALWLGNGAENTAYLPLPLLLLVAASVLTLRSRLQLALGVFATVALVCSFGPLLTIAGQHTVPMPWKLATFVPGLDHALPVRFSAFVFMALAVLVAEAWARGVLPRWLVGAGGALTFVLLLPNLSAMLFPTDASDPEFVTEGELAQTVDPGENVLVLPAGQWGPGMRWQDELDFTFEMPTGNGGGAKKPDMLLDPVGYALFERDLTFDYEATLPDYLERYDVDTIIVDSRWDEWREIVDDALDTTGRPDDGVVVYDVP